MSDGHVEHAALPDLGLWEHVKSHRVPFSFDLEVTARCNNDCRHCCINVPAGSREARDRELTLGEIERLADEAVGLGALWCLVTGGEPLLRDDFADIYLALKRRGLLVSVFTNACLVRDEHVELFRRYPPRELEVTVYGATEETYEAVTRAPGSYAAFRRGLQRLLDGGLKVRLKAVALTGNAHEFSEIAAFCRARTCDYFRFDPVLHLRYDGDLTKNEQIRAERLEPRDVIALELADEERASAWRLGCQTLITEPQARSEAPPLLRCAAGVMSFAVSSEGVFRLCSSLWDPTCTYDLRSGSLTKAWQDFVPRVRERRATSRSFQESCSVCRLVNLCSWCPAHAYLETGNLEAHVSYFCEIARQRAEEFAGAEW